MESGYGLRGIQLRPGPAQRPRSRRAGLHAGRRESARRSPRCEGARARQQAEFRGRFTKKYYPNLN